MMKAIILPPLFILYCLICWLIYSDQQEIQAFLKNTSQLIEQQSIKASLLDRMISATRGRALLILQMYNEDDLFELDAINQEFSNQALNFLAARKILMQMPHSEDELKILKNQQLISMQVYKQQAEIIELLIEERKEETNVLLFKEAILGQNTIVNMLNELSKLYTDVSYQQLNALQKEQNHKSKQTLLLLFFLMGFSLVMLVSFIIKINRDHKKLITQSDNLKIANQIAVKANLAKSNFLANMSHELRTPMHGILSYANLGINKLEKLTPEKNLRYYNNIRKSGDRLMLLLNDLLDLAKLEAGKMDLHFEQASLKDIVQNCLLEQHARAKELNLTIPCLNNCSCIADTAQLDKLRITQVITNLLSNAIKFSPPNDCIDLIIEPAFIDKANGDKVAALLFTIRDYGSGIIEGEQKLVFDKFVQSSNSKAGTTKGTGLGLPICKEIIYLHHGSIWAENHPEGGAIFSFLIPTEQNI
ncbi:MAG: HAMP domain-containing sensor histidine kinase [Pseudomonadota bacterium]